MKKVNTPVDEKTIQELQVGDQILLNGPMLTGRDAALPQLVNSLKKGKKLLNLKGSAIMHTAVSGAGIAPTTSNKEEIEGSMGYLAKAGVLIHIGKGNLSEDTVKSLNEAGAIFVVTPPVAALLTSKVKSKKIAAFEKEGMEAMFELEVEDIPGIVAIAHGESIY
ncbi:fumarate hydratase C-terminal domain-containing protein [Methanobacterium alcaliphilum]|uniref:fumarate hydratase C-terminal domain-containing protein n=1 Tax=Methanobacterium alcaliphilum TaxID=392018 RepID=UPI00200AB659|nr:fumarate hydratase C-terminal domain-containing protein [Methanobacterium alcaliphilum]MCK9150570.1 fumarate hydratase C-terminal domain-containing protein [Methanobacterium alcaliphilum]